jgi:hypothetical protein
MRALDLVETQRRAEEPRRAETLRVAFPLPHTSVRPSVVIKPHPAMLNELPKAVANYEEVRPRPAAPRSSRAAADQPPAFAPLRRTAATAGKLASSLRAGVPGGGYGGASHPVTRDLGEWPLVAFTLLGQAAAGVAVLSFVFGTLPSARVLVGVLLGAAGLVSLLHLGTARRAWRAPVNLKTSALSREIVALGLFVAAWLFAWIAPATGRVALAVAGVGLVESMVRVYDVEAVPAWTRLRTRVAFATSAFVLGALALLLLQLKGSPDTTAQIVVGALAAAVTVQQAISRRRFYLATTVKLM